MVRVLIDGWGIPNIIFEEYVVGAESEHCKERLFTNLLFLTYLGAPYCVKFGPSPYSFRNVRAAREEQRTTSTPQSQKLNLKPWDRVSHGFLDHYTQPWYLPLSVPLRLEPLHTSCSYPGKFAYICALVKLLQIEKSKKYKHQELDLTRCTDKEYHKCVIGVVLL